MLTCSCCGLGVEPATSHRLEGKELCDRCWRDELIALSAAMTVLEDEEFGDEVKCGVRAIYAYTRLYNQECSDTIIDQAEKIIDLEGEIYALRNQIPKAREGGEG